jgi:hypothetical protein
MPKPTKHHQTPKEDEKTKKKGPLGVLFHCTARPVHGRLALRANTTAEQRKGLLVHGRLRQAPYFLLVDFQYHGVASDRRSQTAKS